MEESEINRAKASLDLELREAPLRVGIKFGHELFDAFSRLGYFTLQEFQAVGLPEFRAWYPTYGNRYVWEDGSLPLDEYKVGKLGDAHRP
jgi:hypothetical protein